MIVAFLLPLKEREWRLVYGEDFFAAGIASLVLAILLLLISRILKNKKPRKLAYWLWLLAGSGVAMIVLAYILDATNPGVPSGYLD